MKPTWAEHVQLQYPAAHEIHTHVKESFPSQMRCNFCNRLSHGVGDASRLRGPARVKVASKISAPRHSRDGSRLAIDLEDPAVHDRHPDVSTIGPGDELLHHRIATPQHDLDDLFHVGPRPRLLENEDISTSGPIERLDYDPVRRLVEKSFDRRNVARDQGTRSRGSGDLQKRELGERPREAPRVVENANTLLIELLEETKRRHVLGAARIVPTRVRPDDAQVLLAERLSVRSASEELLDDG